MKVSDQVVMREVIGEHVLLPIGETAKKIHGMMILSESGALLWKRLVEGCTEEELLRALRAEYRIDEETARRDIKEFLNSIEQLQILIREEE